VPTRITSAAAVLAVLAGGVLLPVAAHADTPGTTLYVDNGVSTCTNVGSGTATAPFCTLQAAVTAAQSGDTVDISSPTYEEYYGPLTIATSGITIDGGNARLLTKSVAPAVVLKGVTDVTVDHLSVQALKGQDAIDIDSSHQVTLNSMTANTSSTAEPGTVVAVDGASSGVTLSRSRLFGEATDPTVSVATGASDVVITTNTVSASGTTPAVDVQGANNVDVTSNTVQSINSSAISVSGPSTATIENNVAKESWDAPLAVSADAAPNVTEDYNSLVPSHTDGTRYEWAGAAYPDAAAMAAAGIAQGAHDGDPTLPQTGTPAALIDSANSAAPGELSTDINGRQRLDDPLVADTGTGPISYADRGATEYSDGPSWSPATQPAVEEAGVSVDTQPTDPAPTDSWGLSMTATVDFGDGTPQVTEPVGTPIPHAYTAAGQFTRTTTLTSATGAAQKTAQQVDVLPATPTPLTLSSGAKGGNATFIVDGALASWQYQQLSVDTGDDHTVTMDPTNPDLFTWNYTKVGTYHATVTGTDALGRTVTATTTVVVADAYQPLTGGPKRVYDSRTSGKDKVASHAVVKLSLAKLGLPAGTQDAVIEVTATDTETSGSVSAYPDGAARPADPTLDFATGQIMTNQVTVQPGSDGDVDLYNGSGKAIDLVVSTVGGHSLQAEGAYVPVTPVRLVNTHSSGKHVAAHGSLHVQVPAALGDYAYPALEVDVTAADGKKSGYAIVHTYGSALPQSYQPHWATGQTVTGAVTVVPDREGRFTVYNDSDSTVDFTVDVVGVHSPLTYLGDDTTEFLPTATTRVLDTATGTGAPKAQIGSHAWLHLCLPKDPGVQAAALNVTASGSTAAGSLTVYQEGTNHPGTTDLSWAAKQTVADAVTAHTNTNGCLDVYNNGPKPVTVTADLYGEYVALPQ
jgi:hypothetical protein